MMTPPTFSEADVLNLAEIEKHVDRLLKSLAEFWGPAESLLALRTDREAWQRRVETRIGELLRAWKCVLTGEHHDQSYVVQQIKGLRHLMTGSHEVPEGAEAIEQNHQ